MQRARQSLAALVAVLIVTAACASRAPASLSPSGVKVWQANEVQVALGTVQRTAIALNDVQRCDAAGANCAPVLSDDNTEKVIDAVEVGIKTLRASPGGWAAAADSALREIEAKLDAAGKAKLGPYITAARAVIAALR